MNKLWATMFMFMLFVSLASASEVTTDRLNFYGTEQHTINITNTLGGSANAVSTMPSGFSFVSSVSGCTNPSGQTVECNSIASDGSVEYIISSPSSGTEYELYTLNTTLNGSALNDVDFINIRDNEIFHTLVEYGRGRGNYFYDSMGSATSAGTGTGYNYVPNGTDFELNYLHKVYNVKQYYGLANSRATDVSFTCTYPYHTVVRSHLVSTMTDDNTDWTVAYSLPRIDGSWERMGFLGMDFDSGEYDVGDTFTINCTNLQYSLADAYGDMVVDEDSFNMEVRSPDPLSVTASSASAEIGNGTSEVEITYTFTNDELYPMDKVAIEIDAPENAQFIGVRGELWGSARDKYLYELTEMDAGQVESITLVARFDTSASADTTLLLTQGIKAQFVPTWELNAYNPLTYIQELSPTDTQTVNYASSASINSIQTQLNRIDSNVILINNSVVTIQTLVEEINSTTHTIDTNLLNVNTTLYNQINAINQSLSTQMTNNFNSLTSDISDLSTQMTNFENNVQALVNCTSSPSAPLCSRIDEINTSLTNVQNNLLTINTSLSTQINNVNSSIMNELSTQFNSVYANFTYTNSLIESVNGTLYTAINSINLSGANVTVDLSEVLSGLSEINTTTNSIQSDVTDLGNNLLSINSSLASSITSNSASILSAINNGFASLNSSTQEILTELSYMQDFNEELIFLVTDSVGLANEGKAELANGNPEVAIKKLNAAEDKLLQAKDLMQKEKKPLENKIDIENANVFMKIIYKVKGLFL